MPDYAQPLNDWLAQAPPQPPPRVMGKSLAELLGPYLGDPNHTQAAADAAAQRVRAPYAKANEHESGLPQVLEYFGNKIASALTAPRDALTGAMQVNDPVTGMPTPEAMQRGQGVAGLAMTGGIPMAERGAAGMAGGRLAQPRDPSLTPAIRHNGKVYSADDGGTHLDALSKVPQDQRAAASLNGDNRVYVTQNGRILDRWRGQDFAIKNDLIDPSAPSYARNSPELIGEWLRRQTPEQRRAAPPWTTEDVPREQQIVRGASGGPQMSEPFGGDNRKFHIGFEYIHPEKGWKSTGNQVVMAPDIESAARQIARERQLNDITITKRFETGKPASEAEAINKSFQFNFAPPPAPKPVSKPKKR